MARMTKIIALGSLLWGISPAFGQTTDWEAGIARVRTVRNLGRLPGTAFVVALQGSNAYLLTSAHVVEGDESPQIEFHADPEKSYRARVRAIETGDDRGLALLVVANPPSGLRPIGEADQTPVLGASVTVVGYPASIDAFSRIDTTVASLRGRDLYLSYETDDGFSGGPIIRNDRVVGIVYGREGGFGKALGSSSVKPFLDGSNLRWDEGPVGLGPRTRLLVDMAASGHVWAYPGGSARFLDITAYPYRAGITHTEDLPPAGESRVVFSFDISGLRESDVTAASIDLRPSNVVGQPFGFQNIGTLLVEEVSIGDMSQALNSPARRLVSRLDAFPGDPIDVTVPVQEAVRRGAQRFQVRLFFNRVFLSNIEVAVAASDAYLEWTPGPSLSISTTK